MFHFISNVVRIYRGDPEITFSHWLRPALHIAIPIIGATIIFLAHELYTAAIVYGLCTTFISYGVGVFFFRLIKKMAKIKTSEEIRVSETREPKVNLGAIFSFTCAYLLLPFPTHSWCAQKKLGTGTIFCSTDLLTSMDLVIPV
jgi:hypothetical protein